MMPLDSPATLSRRHVLACATAAALLPPWALAQTATQQSRKIPRSSESLPVVGLGTPRIFDYEPDPTRQTQMTAIIAGLIAGGGRMIDTANGYGRGEQRLGEIIEALGARKKLFVATKYSSLDTPEQQKASVQHSQAMLRMQQFDLLYAWGVKDADFDLGFLRDLQAKGVTRYIGVASGRDPDLAALEQLLRRGKPDFLHFPYSLDQRSGEERLFPAARDAGVAVVATLPFGGSSLFSRVAGKTLPAWAGEIGIHSWAQFFLKFVLSDPAIVAAVPGTDKIANLTDNLAAGLTPAPTAAQRKQMLDYWSTL